MATIDTYSLICRIVEKRIRSIDGIAHVTVDYGHGPTGEVSSTHIRVFDDELNLIAAVAVRGDGVQGRISMHGAAEDTKWDIHSTRFPVGAAIGTAVGWVEAAAEGAK